MIDLTRIPIGVINLPGAERRRGRITEALTGLGLKFQLIEAVAAQPRHWGCSQSHLKAVTALRGHGPFLVLEDDATPTEAFRVTVARPEGANLLYLGHSRFGFSRSAGKIGTPELTEDAGDFLRVHSMLAAHAILYLNDQGADEVTAAIHRSINRRRPLRHDMALCELQARTRVMAVRAPWFFQSGGTQRAVKREARGEEEEFTALPRQPGDQVVAEDESGSVPLIVARNAAGGLEFQREGLPAAAPSEAARHV
jgi:hypothetical protein